VVGLGLIGLLFYYLHKNEGVEHFIQLEDFKHITGAMMRELRASHKALDQPRIYTAGEKEYYNTLKNQAEGIEITPGVQKALLTLQQELDIPGDSLGF
jgi:L-2-hydroxycarboxylate dehydrogenase (NAD+)